MSLDNDLSERLSPTINEPLRVPVIPASILQTGKTSAFRRVSPNTSPAENSRVMSHRRDCDSHSDSGTMDHMERTIENSLSKTHSEECDSKCSCKSNATDNENKDSNTDGKGKRTNDKETASNPQKTPTKPKLSFSVEAIMSTKTSPSSSHQTSQHESQHSRSRESSFSSPSSDRYKENYSPAISEASSRESDLTSPPPPHPAHREGFEGLLGKAQGPFPPHHPFLAAAGAASPDGVQWPWLGGHHPTPGPLSKFKFCFVLKIRC